MKTNGKKISRRNLALPSALILGLGVTGAVTGARADIDTNQFLTACKNVTLYKAKDADEAARLRKAGCAVDYEALGAGASASFANNLKVVRRVNSDQILEVVKAQFQGMVQEKINYWKNLEKNLDKNPGFKADYGNFVARLRQDLTVGAPEDGQGAKIKSFATPWYKGVAADVKNLFSKEKETTTSKSIFPESVIGNGVVSGEELDQAKKSKLPKTPAAAQADYKNTIEQGKEKIFFLSYLDKPTSFQDGKPTWSDAQWRKAIDKMVAELEKTKNQKDRDLIDPALLPLVNKFLSDPKHKADCGLITAEVNDLKKEKGIGEALFMAGAMATGAELSIASKFSEGEGVVFKAVGGAVALGGDGVGVAMTYMDYAHTKTVAHQTQAIAAADVGGPENSAAYRKIATQALDEVNDWGRKTLESQGVMVAGLGGGAFAAGKIFSKTPAGRKALSLAAMELADGKQVDAFAAKAAQAAEHAAAASPKEGAALKAAVTENLASPELNAVRDLKSNLEFQKADREIQAMRAAPGKEGLTPQEIDEIHDVEIQARLKGESPDEIASAVKKAEETCGVPK